MKVLRPVHYLNSPHMRYFENSLFCTKITMMIISILLYCINPVMHFDSMANAMLLQDQSTQEIGNSDNNSSTQDAREEVKEEDLEDLFKIDPSLRNDFFSSVNAQNNTNNNSSNSNSNNNNNFLGNQEPQEQPQSMMPVVLEGVSVEKLVLQISEWTGKPVFAHKTILKNQITLVNSKLMPKDEALNLIFVALSLHDIGVVDRGTHIALVPIREIQEGACPVIGANEDILLRKDTGMVAEKVFQIVHGTAENISKQIIDGKLLPRDINIAFDAESNQIVVRWTIGTLQHIQNLINELDIKSTTTLVLETFYLHYSRAEDIAQAIVDLFSADDSSSSRGGSGNTLFGGGGNSRRDQLFGGPSRGGSSSGQSGVQTTERLKVTFDKRQNSVTVLAEKEVIDQIKVHIADQWDLASEPPAQLIYDVQNNSAVKMKELLDSILSEDNSSMGTVVGNNFTGRGGTFNNRQRNQPTGSSGETARLHPLAGLVTIEADEDKNRLIIIARAQDHLDQIMKLIKEMDEPVTNTIPEVYELKYADAWALSDILNAILAPEGATATIERISNFLSEGTIGDSETGTTGSTSSQAGNQEGFPWQSAAASRQENRKLSGMIGQARIVPFAQRNALLVLTPPEHRASIAELIEKLDKPARQVLIQAIVAEISEDAIVEMGMRWGGDGVASSASSDNLISSVTNIEGTKNNLLTSLFDTSVLGINVNLNAILQLLRSDTDSNVLSLPKVVTSDNEEALFFDGQQIPFISQNADTNNTGQFVQNFEYKDVGIRLAVRPHITVEGNVDLRVNLQLASVVPGQTLFGGLILDNRTTSTKITIRNGQTVVISGILRDQYSEVIRKVPLLGDIPIIGAFFRSKSLSTEKAQLVAFIRPIILENLDVLDNTNTKDHDILRKLNYDPDAPVDYGYVKTEDMSADSLDSGQAQTGNINAEQSGNDKDDDSDSNNTDKKDPAYFWKKNHRN